MIGSHRVGANGFQITLDDGTGRIGAVVWITEQNPVMHPAPEALYNRFVSVRGQLTGFRSEIQIKVESVTVIASESEWIEESLWCMEVKDEWEELAALGRKATVSDRAIGICPCVCHSAGGTPCRTIGSVMSWPHSFSRAVAVMSSALRILAASSSLLVTLSMSEIVSMVNDNLPSSPSLQAVKCYKDCAIVQAVRDLIKLKYIIRDSSGTTFRLFSKPQLAEPQSPTGPCQGDEPRFPMTPIDMTQSLSSQPVVIARPGVVRERRNPMFVSAGTHDSHS